MYTSPNGLNTIQMSILYLKVACFVYPVFLKKRRIFEGRETKASK